jgi:signal peptidase I
VQQDGYYFYKKRKRFSDDFVREILRWILGIFISIFFAFITVYFFGLSVHVECHSDSLGFVADQNILVNRFIYKISQPKPGDVVIFLPNGNINTQYYIKRVVAVPGDRVVIKEGLVYVNDVPSEYVTEKITDPGIASSEITVESGSFFCIGDNIYSAEDSRSANIGPVKSKFILGKVWYAFSQGDSKGHLVN